MPRLLLIAVRLRWLLYRDTSRPSPARSEIRRGSVEQLSMKVDVSESHQSEVVLNWETSNAKWLTRLERVRGAKLEQFLVQAVREFQILQRGTGRFAVASLPVTTS